MSLLLVRYKCGITGKPCVQGSTKDCPISADTMIPWCKHFVYVEMDEHGKEVQGVPES